jgi:hypothetical protein
MRKSRIKKEAERAIIYRMVIGIVQRIERDGFAELTNADDSQITQFPHLTF